MSVRVKSGGAWIGPIAAGNISVKSGGQWVRPGTLKVKSGGLWRDSGYVGPPNPPSFLRVATTATNYSTLQFTWDAAAGGGPPIDYYEVQLLDVNGNPIVGAAENSTDLFSPGWGISQDTNYQGRVRSHGPNGLSSPWVYIASGSRPRIGHPLQMGNRLVARTRAWRSGVRNFYGMTRDYLAVIDIPSNVTTSIMWVNLWTNFANENYISWTGGNRILNAYYNNAEQHLFGMYAPIEYNPLRPGVPAANGFAWNTGSGNSGFYVRGAGWSIFSGAGNRLWCDMEIHGTETYYENESYVAVTEVQNSTW